MAEEKAITTKSVVLSDEQKEEKNTSTKAAQSEYKGNHHMDKVEVTINQKTKYYKKGQKDTVHPTVALIMQEKGIIDKGWEKNVKPYNAPRVEDGKLIHN